MPLLEIILNSAVQSLKVKFEYIPLEYEQVVLNALLQAHELGEQHAHAKPTIPQRKSSQNIPVVRPDSFPFADEVTPVGFKRHKKNNER